uniref:Uncharacterized protein n=1 Tax=Cacopsylla melanoneura TaxID=428564 RepID=A0A8D8RM17_9HEMI
MVSLPKSMKTTPTCGRQPRTTTSSNEPQEKRPARNRTINNRNGQTLEAIDKRLTEFQILYSQIGKVRPLQVGNSQTLSMVGFQMDNLKTTTGKGHSHNKTGVPLLGIRTTGKYHPPNPRATTSGSHLVMGGPMKTNRHGEFSPDRLPQGDQVRPLSEPIQTVGMISNQFGQRGQPHKDDTDHPPRENLRRSPSVN